MFHSLFHYKQNLSDHLYLTCGIGPVWMWHRCANRPRVDLVMVIAASWRSEAAGVEMMVRVIKWMDGMSTNHSCEWIQDRKMLNIQTSMHMYWNAPYPSLLPQIHWTGEPAAQQIYNDTKMTCFNTNFPTVLQHFSSLRARTQPPPKRQSSPFSCAESTSLLAVSFKRFLLHLSKIKFSSL